MAAVNLRDLSAAEAVAALDSAANRNNIPGLITELHGVAEQQQQHHGGETTTQSAWISIQPAL